MEIGLCMARTRKNRRGIAVYLDTCIVSGLAKGDLAPPDVRALEWILQQHKQRHLRLATSAVTKFELAKIPARFRIAHSAVNELLDVVPARVTFGFWGAERAIEDPNWWTFERLTWLLPDAIDAEHLTFAIQAGFHHFITTDERTILRHKRKLLSDFDVRAMSPRAFKRYWVRSMDSRHPKPPGLMYDY